MIVPTAPAGETLVLVRTFAAPPERVYRAWTDPERLGAWFRPNERWLPSTATLDVREGGEMRIEMRHSDGDAVTILGRYREIVPNARLVFACRFLMGDPDAEETQVALEFAPDGDGTRLTLTQTGIGSVEGSKNYESGWNGCLDGLAAGLSEGGSAAG